MIHGDESEENDNIELWKIKNLNRVLSSVRGNGTSMISLIIPPGDQISRVNKMLSEEYSTAINIKSRVNRLSVMSAIISVQQKLKLYSKVPENGLILYGGTILDEHNKEKKLTFDIKPIKAINTSLYLCDNKFHTDILSSLLEKDEKTGFIIVDGKGLLIGQLNGNRSEILTKLSVNLPKKHGRGGQSAARFGRIRLEKRNHFLKKIAEISSQHFIPDGQKANIQGLIIGGSSEFKNELNSSELLDERLRVKLIQIIDLSYGGEAGFNQAIEYSSSILSDVKFIKEKKLLQSYFDEINKDTGKYIYGAPETIEMLISGAIEKLILWENFEMIRVTLENSSTKKEYIKILEKNHANDSKFLKILENKTDCLIVKKELLSEWVVDNRKNFGATLFFVSDKTPEGNQFKKGFGGIGGILRYNLKIENLSEISD
jgi:peptide chain release factor subunit 1